MKLTKDERAVLFGTILGDAYLQPTGKHNARLRLEHTFAHREYMLWKIRRLAGLFQGKPKTLRRRHPLSHKTYQYIRHQSQSSPYLGRLRRIFYPQGQKKIPEDLSRWLIAPVTLAAWYMDDGYYYERDKRAYLYLGRVSRAEAETVRAALAERFALESKVLDKRQKGLALYFSPPQVIRLKQIIESNIAPSMAYKLPS